MNWSFPSNNYGDINGISNSGVETFQGTPLKSLAREICQNSLDAKINDTIPVEVEFMPFSMDYTNFPNGEGLKEVFNAAKSFWAIQKSKKTTDFCDRSLKIMSEGNIPFLRVSDFNTTGLTGSKAEFNTPWCNLTKSSGASDKAGTSGGSFGIGKFAPFACSDFRTVFYSTLDIEGQKAFQGISRIVSFKNADDEITVGVGYYGGENNSPVFSDLQLDDLYNRGERTGTDIYISSFKSPDTEWKESVIASVLDGFLYSIYSGKLIVRVDDVEINKETLESLLVEYGDFLNENAEKYYLVLTSDETSWFEVDYKGHGKIRLGLLLKPEMHRRVAMIRQTGMKIIDRGNISSIIHFAGVMLIEGEQVNDFLRNIENPQHTKWEPDRIEPKQKVPYAKEYVKGLIDYIKNCLEEINHDDDSEIIDPSVGEFLPDDNDIILEGEKHEQETLPNIIKTVEVSTPPRGYQPNNATVNGDDAIEDDGEDTGIKDDTGAGHNDGEESNHGSGAGDNEGEGEGSIPKEKPQSLVGIQASKVRTVCIDKLKGTYSVTFTPVISAIDGYMDIFLSAETQNYAAPILDVSDIKRNSFSFANNRITGLSFEKDTPIRLIVKLDYFDYCSMEVKAHGHKI